MFYTVFTDKRLLFYTFFTDKRPLFNSFFTDKRILFYTFFIERPVVRLKDVDGQGKESCKIFTGGKSMWSIGYFLSNMDSTRSEEKVTPV